MINDADSQNSAPRRRELHSMWFRNGCLLFGLLVPLLLGAPDVVTPPGNVWEPLHNVAAVLVIVGAYLGGHRRRSAVLYLAYGSAASFWFLPQLLPDPRDYLAMASGTDSIAPYMIRSCAFVAGMALACWGAGATRGMVDRHFETEVAEVRCKKCGYPLFGLPERRCPECGEAFQHDIPNHPDG